MIKTLLMIAIVSMALFAPAIAQRNINRGVGDNDRELRQHFNDIEQRRALREIERNTSDRGIDTDWCVDGRGVRYLCRDRDRR